MAVDALHMRGINTVVKPVQSTYLSLGRRLTMKGRILVCYISLVFLSAASKFAAWRFEVMAARLTRITTLSERQSKALCQQIPSLAGSAENFYRCADKGRKLRQTSIDLGHTATASVLRVLVDDHERLAQRIEDLAETLALAVNKPFMDIVRDELKEYAPDQLHG